MNSLLPLSWAFLLAIVGPAQQDALTRRAPPVQTASHAPAQQGGHSAASLPPQDLFKRLAPSIFVVDVVGEDGSVVALGSGVAVADGQVVTNKHVIEGGASLRLNQGIRTWSAVVAYLDPDHDLCLLTAEGLKAPAVPVRPSSELKVGERVYSIGAPEGLELTISEGLISGLRQFEQARLIQTSAAISRGSSGGGLFDSEGRLVGITTFYFKEGQNLNFALPGEWVKALAPRTASAPRKSETTTRTTYALSWFQLGVQMLDAGDYLEADRAFRWVISLAPNSSEGWNGLGLTYERSHQYDKAVRAFQEAIRLNPSLREAWNGLGLTYMELKQFQEALHAYREAIRIGSDDSTGWNGLGSAYLQLHEDHSALQAFNRASILNPSDVTAWNNLGLTYSLLHQYDKAIPAYKEAIRLKPNLDGTWYLLGIAYERLSQYDKALPALEEATRLKPNDEESWKALGVAYDNLQQYDKALSALKEAIRLAPDDNGAWNGVGSVYDDLQQPDKAIPAFLEAIRLRPDNARAWYNLGLVYDKQGDPLGVRTVYEKLKTLDQNLADDFSRKTTH